jgi:putative N6-adenine-specific DNA methylase
VKEFTGKIVGYDIDARMLNAARINIESAEMEDLIEVRKQNFFDSKKDLFPLLMVFNPPYDERISINDDDFYKKIGDTFKTNYPNTLAWLISSDLEAVKKIGLRPSRKIKLFNGKLETRFLQYEMYEGTKKVHKLEEK